MWIFASTSNSANEDIQGGQYLPLISLFLLRCLWIVRACIECRLFWLKEEDEVKFSQDILLKTKLMQIEGSLARVNYLRSHILSHTVLNEVIFKCL